MGFLEKALQKGYEVEALLQALRKGQFEDPDHFVGKKVDIPAWLEKEEYVVTGDNSARLVKKQMEVLIHPDKATDNGRYLRYRREGNAKDDGDLWETWQKSLFRLIITKQASQNFG